MRQLKFVVSGAKFTKSFSSNTRGRYSRSESEVAQNRAEFYPLFAPDFFWGGGPPILGPRL